MRLVLVATNVSKHPSPFVLDAFNDLERLVVPGADPRKTNGWLARLEDPNHVIDPGAQVRIDKDFALPSGFDPRTIHWRMPYDMRYRFRVQRLSWGDIEVVPRSDVSIEQALRKAALA